MGRINRREFLRQAAYSGAALLWSSSIGRASTVTWQERRDLFPQGVASGDPDPHSVILWTRRPPLEKPASKLTVEIAEDAAFRRVVGKKDALISVDTDWTCR